MRVWTDRRELSGLCRLGSSSFYIYTSSTPKSFQGLSCIVLLKKNVQGSVWLSRSIMFEALDQVSQDPLGDEKNEVPSTCYQNVQNNRVEVR